MIGYIDPTKETFAAFRANGRAGPIHMLNLVRFRDKAAYPDGRDATGAEAYAAYAVLLCFASLGVFRAASRPFGIPRMVLKKGGLFVLFRSAGRD